ncbi:MAG: hypothetical protein ABIH76_04070, partial [Candidatus Bathyarchaeota archaeon]
MEHENGGMRHFKQFLIELFPFFASFKKMFASSSLALHDLTIKEKLFILLAVGLVVRFVFAIHTMHPGTMEMILSTT